MGRIKRIILFGASGFTGRALIEFYRNNEDFECIAISREKVNSCTYIQWNGKQVNNQCLEAMNDSYAVINLCGKLINCALTKKNRRELYNSRLNTTELIGDAIAQLQNPPKLWLNMSSTAIYRHSYDVIHDENSVDYGPSFDLNDSFFSNLAHQWEEKCTGSNTPLITKIIIRISLIFGHQKSGVFDELKKIISWGFGGKILSGKQTMLFIHIDDFCRAIHHCLTQEKPKSVYNFITPHASMNSNLMRIFADLLKKRVRLPMPSKCFLRFIAKIFLRDSSLLEKNIFVKPKNLIDEGFEFKYSKIEDTLKDLLKK